MRPSARVSAEGLPAVIMMICFLSFRWRASTRWATRSPSRVLVCQGPTFTRAISEMGISSAESWNRTSESESPGYWVRMRWENAMATRLAGVKRSSPYRIMEWEQSSMTTVAQELWYSHWWTWRSEYSSWRGRLSPSRAMAELKVVVASRLRVSPNS